MNPTRVWLLMLIGVAVLVPSPSNTALGTIMGFSAAQFIAMLSLMALVYTEAIEPTPTFARRRTMEVADFENITLNGMKYDVHIRDKDINLIPLGVPAEPPEPTKAPTPMDNVLVRVQGRVNALSVLENAEITPENEKAYSDITADLTKIAEEVERTPSLKNSEQYNDFVQALALAQELAIDVGARFNK